MAGNAWKPPQAGCLSMLGQQSQEVQSTAATCLPPVPSVSPTMGSWLHLMKPDSSVGPEAAAHLSKRLGQRKPNPKPIDTPGFW